MKYYAIRVGRAPGIYESWAEAEPLVKGCKAEYKSFSTREQAQEWLQAKPLRSAELKRSEQNRPIVKRSEPKRPIVLPLEPSQYDREFWVHSVYSSVSGRVAWAVLSNRDQPLASVYAGPAPEHPERAVLCAVLRIMTRANMDPLLKDKRLLVHFCHPNWAVCEALTRWIYIWTKKRWRDGQVHNLDLYQLIWPLLKTTNIRFQYHNPQHGEPTRLAEITALAKETADRVL